MNSQTSATPTCITGVGEIDRLGEHLRRRLGGRIRNIRVLVRYNGLVLQGRSHTYYLKQLAQHAVMEVTVVPIVANEIEVGPATTET